LNECCICRDRSRPVPTIIAIAHAIITKGIAEGPDFGDDGGGGVCVVAHLSEPGFSRF